MEEHNINRYSEGQSDHNDLQGMREPTIGDCWKPMLNDNYSDIRHQPIDTNNFELKPALIFMGTTTTVWRTSFR